MSQTPTAQPVLLVGDSTDALFLRLVRATTDSGMTCKVVHWPENGHVPEGLFQNATAKTFCRGLILVHRRSVGPMEMLVLEELRTIMDSGKAPRPRLELALGDLVRYAEVQVLEQIVDRVTPEAVMLDVLPGRLARFSGRALKPARNQTLARVGILSTNQDLASILADLVQWAGFTPVVAEGWSDRRLTPGALVVWDIPVLSDRWQAELQAQARRRPVLALLAMSHRDITAQAKAAGAVACLDLPFETEDLADLFAQYVPQDQSIKGLQPVQPQQPSSIRLRSGGAVLRPDTGHKLMREPRDHASPRHPARRSEPATKQELSNRNSD